MFVASTYDWCVTCKFNKFMALDSIRIIELFQKINKCEENLLTKITKYINY